MSSIKRNSNASNLCFIGINVGVKHIHIVEERIVELSDAVPVRGLEVYKLYVLCVLCVVSLCVVCCVLCVVLLYCVLCIVVLYCVLCIVHCALCIVHCVLLYCVLCCVLRVEILLLYCCIVHCVLCIVYCVLLYCELRFYCCIVVLCIVYCVLCIVYCCIVYCCIVVLLYCCIVVLCIVLCVSISSLKDHSSSSSSSSSFLIICLSVCFTNLILQEHRRRDCVSGVKWKSFTGVVGQVTVTRLQHLAWSSISNKQQKIAILHLQTTTNKQTNKSMCQYCKAI